jgi:hypothetical protein
MQQKKPQLATCRYAGVCRVVAARDRRAFAAHDVATRHCAASAASLAARLAFSSHCARGMCMCMCVHVCMCVCMYVYVCMCMCVCALSLITTPTTHRCSAVHSITSSSTRRATAAARTGNARIAITSIARWITRCIWALMCCVVWRTAVCLSIRRAFVERERERERDLFVCVLILE